MTGLVATHAMRDNPERITTVAAKTPDAPSPKHEAPASAASSDAQPALTSPAATVRTPAVEPLRNAARKPAPAPPVVAEMHSAEAVPTPAPGQSAFAAAPSAASPPRVAGRGCREGGELDCRQRRADDRDARTHRPRRRAIEPPGLGRTDRPAARRRQRDRGRSRTRSAALALSGLRNPREGAEGHRHALNGRHRQKLGGFSRIACRTMPIVAPKMPRAVAKVSTTRPVAIAKWPDTPAPSRVRR